MQKVERLIMNKSLIPAKLSLILLLILSTRLWAAATDLATAPLETSADTSVKPNVLFILDDSGSMGWDFLPDWACSSLSRTNSSCSSTGEDPSSTRHEYLFKNSVYNGVAYNPAITYSPPIYFDGSGNLDTTTYPSMTGQSTATGGGVGASAASPNWKAVKNDGYGVSTTATTDLTSTAYYWLLRSGSTSEYCTTPALKSCTTQAAPSTTYPYLAPLRWCKSDLTTCQAVFNSASGFRYTYARAASPNMATITVGNNFNSTTVSSVRVGTQELLSATTASSDSTSTVAARIAANINNCTVAASSPVGNCPSAGTGYVAYSSGAVVTIAAPPFTTTAFTPAVTKTGNMTFTVAASTASAVPGANLLTVINPNRNSYPYPGNTSKALTRTDCAGTTCTYIEEMTNYANWWAYYSIRMQMMKTSASHAFKTVNSTYRAGYMSLNNNTGTDFLNLGEFNNTQRQDWYNKLFNSDTGNSTPLRTTLVKAGRLYAGKYNASSLNGVTVTDPVQYSCQQNFTILSTDGYWNETSTPRKIDGSTAISNQDGQEARPMFDGKLEVVTDKTPTVTRSVDTSTRTVIDKKSRTDQSVTTAQKSRPNTYTRTRITTSSSGCSGGKRKVRTRLYSANAVETQKTPTTTSQQYQTTTTTIYEDVKTTTTTDTRTVVTTNGVQTSDTTATTVSSNTVSTITSGPTSSDTAVGSPTVVVGGTTSTTNPADILNDASWSQTSDNTGGCITGAPAESDTFTLASNGTFGATTNTGPVVTSGTPAQVVGYPQTSSTTPTNDTTGPTVGTTTSTTTTSGGTSDTLADVAQYYYATDLRTSTLSNCTGSVSGENVCENNVPSSGNSDTASWQHMTTYTLGLGVNGYMQYTPGYSSAQTGDYYDISRGIGADPASGICTWQASGACNWPVPGSNTQTTIDDLWHAAVNGRGTYFSASNPDALSSSLSTALSDVSSRVGSSAAATTSNPNITSGDNFVFSSTFTSKTWDGELVRQQLDLTTGVTLEAIDWAARDRLDARTSRLIYTYDAATANKLKEFTSANYGSNTNFSQSHIAGLSQFCASGVTCLSSGDQANAAGANLVDFIRGVRTNEGVTTDTSKYYRKRQHVLGDIVNAEAVYVKGSLFNYADFGYASFAADISDRQGMVYAASNDGMLHAFYATDGTDATGGEEAWAYIPNLVFPNLYKLADKNYANNHQYFVDGTPAVSDICVSSCIDDPDNDSDQAVWKTILVGGLNGGGRGYYALDITNPEDPKALWEFTDTNMGYTYGNPKIAKLSDGTWVVLVTSGYNNVSTGDGKGYLYILDANTGALIRTISTNVGSSSGEVLATDGSNNKVCAVAPCPSGLANIAVRVVNPSSDNTIQQVYGGDLYGNLWRFDPNGNVGASGYDAQLLAVLRGPAGNYQPITTKPEIATVNNVKVIYVGTGSYLGQADVSDTSKQSIYALKDELSTATTSNVAIFPNPRSFGGFVEQIQTATTCPVGSPPSICSTGQIVRTSTNNTVNFASDNGWFIDLIDTGERANTDPTLGLGTLGFTTNVPNSTACTVGGYSYRYFLDYRTGGPVSTSSTGVASAKLGNALATRPVYVRLPNNTIVELTRLSDGRTITSNVPIGGGATNTRRTSWRELNAE
jgi:type IV pilus assembly protein PilY1